MRQNTNILERMSFEKYESARVGVVEKGIEVCEALKKEKPDAEHWKNIECREITPEEAGLVEEFSKLRKNYLKEEASLFSLNAKTRDLIITRGSPVAEALMNEIVSLRLKQKHREN